MADQSCRDPTQQMQNEMRTLLWSSDTNEGTATPTTVYAEDSLHALSIATCLTQLINTDKCMKRSLTKGTACITSSKQQRCPFTRQAHCQQKKTQQNKREIMLVIWLMLSAWCTWKGGHVWFSDLYCIICMLSNRCRHGDG